MNEKERKPEQCEEIDLSPEEEEALEAAWTKRHRQQKSSRSPSASADAGIPPPSGS